MANFWQGEVYKERPIYGTGDNPGIASRANFKGQFDGWKNKIMVAVFRRAPTMMAARVAAGLNKGR